MRRPPFLRVLAVAAAVAGGLPAVTSAPAHADTLGEDQAQAAMLVARLNVDYQRLDVLAAQYEQAQEQVESLYLQSAAIQAQEVQTSAQVGTLTGHLRQDAIAAYVDGGMALQGVAVLMTASANQAALGQAYLGSVSADTNAAINTLDAVDAQLHAQSVQLHAAQAAATANLNRMGTAQRQAQAETSVEKAALSQVKGRLGQLVAQQEASLAAANVANANVSSLGQLGSLPLSGQGGAAVQAAQSFLGVPYVWGGASRSGVDCSGLVMLAWQAAGVNLPRTSEEQYAATNHVSPADIQPGDLVFYNGNSHVAMYVGNNTVIEALHTGTNVGYWGIGYAGTIDGIGRP